MKLTMSLALLLFESGRTGSTMLGELCQFKFNLPFLIPAAIYTCTNNLSFLIYERLDPGSECFDDCQVFFPCFCRFKQSSVRMHSVDAEIRCGVVSCVRSMGRTH